MVKLVPGSQHIYPTTTKEGEIVEYDSEIPYKGDVYVDSRVEIIYGVASAISSEMIIEFLSSNDSILKEKGYYLSSFI